MRCKLLPALLMAVACDGAAPSPSKSDTGTTTSATETDADADADADTDTDTDTDTDADTDTDTDTTTLNDTADAGFQLVINEVLVNAATLDANCDGLTDAADDEFIELVNAGELPVDLSGATVSDLMAERHAFPDGTTLMPGEALLIFGGGTPSFSGTSSAPEPWCVALPRGLDITVASTGELALDDAGDTLVLRGRAGGELARAEWGTDGNAAESLNRSPELTDTELVVHSSVPGAMTLISPGTLVDGQPLQEEADTGDTAPPTLGLPIIGDVILHEILFDPAADDLGDANCDGVRDSSQDEFVEIVNIDAVTIDLSGATVSDAIGPRHTFPFGTVVEPWETIVVFGGGSPALDGGPGDGCAPLPDHVSVVTADDGMLGLNNTGDIVTLTARDGTLLDQHEWSEAIVSDESLTRARQGTAGAWTAHSLLAVAPHSPGRAASGSPIGPPGPDTGLEDTGTALETADTGHDFVDTGVPVLPGRVVVLNEILADPGDHDASCDGLVDTTADEFVELVGAGDEGLDLSGATLSDAVTTRHVFPEETVLRPGEVLVVFGAGAADFDAPHPDRGAHCRGWDANVRWQVASTGGLGLNNAGDTVTLADDTGAVLDVWSYGSEGGEDQSLVRAPELTGAFVRHATAPGATSSVSPGLRTTLTAFPDRSPDGTD